MKIGKKAVIIGVIIAMVIVVAVMVILSRPRTESALPENWTPRTPESHKKSNFLDFQSSDGFVVLMFCENFGVNMT